MTISKYTDGDITEIGASGAKLTYDGSDVGLLEEMDFDLNYKRIPIKGIQDPAPRGSVIDEASLIITAGLKQHSEAKFRIPLAKPQDISGGFGDQPLRGSQPTAVAASLFPLDGLPRPQFVIGKCKAFPNGKIKYDGQRVIPIILEAFWDPSADTGKELWYSYDAVDAAGPTVSSTSPADEATGVATSVGAISVTFGEQVGTQFAAIQYITIAKNDGSAIITPTAAAINGAGTVITWTIPALTAATVYLVTISPLICDISGNKLRGDGSTNGTSKVINFTTA